MSTPRAPSTGDPILKQSMEIAQELADNGVTPSMLLSDSAVTYEVSYGPNRENGTYSDREPVKIASFEEMYAFTKEGAGKIFVTFQSRTGLDLKERTFDLLNFINAIRLFSKTFKDRGVYRFLDCQNNVLDQYWPRSTDSDDEIGQAVSLKNFSLGRCVSIQFLKSTFRNSPIIGLLQEQHIDPDVGKTLESALYAKFQRSYYFGQLFRNQILVLSIMCFLIFTTIVSLYILTFKRDGRQELLVDNDFESEQSGIIEVVPATYSNFKCSLSRYLGLMDLMFLCIF
eukprot:610094_1